MSARSWIVAAVVGVAILLALFAWPKSLQVIDTSKVCQLTGDWDKERIKQTVSKGAGATGTDLGYPVEHLGQIFFLFGDTRRLPPDLYPPGFGGLFEDGADSVAVAPAKVDVDRDECVPLRFVTEPSGSFQPIRRHEAGHPEQARPLGAFETPVSGFSVRGILFAFFTPSGTAEVTAASFRLFILRARDVQAALWVTQDPHSSLGAKPCWPGRLIVVVRSRLSRACPPRDPVNH